MLIAETGDWSSLGSVVSMVANIGFSGVVAWYLLSRAIPDMQAKFSAMLDGQAVRHDKEMVAARDSFERMITSEKKHFTESLQYMSLQHSTNKVEVHDYFESLENKIDVLTETITKLVQKKSQ